MWLSSITPWLILAAAGIEAEAGLPAAAPAMPRPIATRQTEFGIPFTFEQARQPSRQPDPSIAHYVELFVSDDLGKTWHLYGKVEASRRHFVFQAPHDGEYWFRLRTYCTVEGNRSGQQRPKDPGPPGLVVVVDTVPPKLQLTAGRGDAGQITARWTIDEPHPKPDALTIQYRTTTDGPWQQVAISRQQPHDGGTLGTGEVTWWTRANSGQVQIRGELSDTAGNPAVSHAIVNLTRQPRFQGLGPEPVRRIANPSYSTAAAVEVPGAWRASTPDQPPAEPPADASLVHYPTDDQPPPVQPPAAGTAADTQRPPPFRAGLPVDATVPSFSQPGPQTPPSGQPVNPPVQPPIQPPVGQPPYPTTGLPAFDTTRAVAGPNAGPNAAPVDRPVQSQTDQPNVQAGNPAGGSLPPGVRPRMVNSRQFDIPYDDRSLGPVGTARVELWGTRDAGQTWRIFATDNDNRNPLWVFVDEQGIYAFRVVVQRSVGPGDRLPQRGDLPDLWIGVDLTRPTALITSANLGVGPESGRLVITWQADDWMPAARPVTLSFAERPGGPWTTLAAGLENTGRYAWPIDRRTPQMVYLRLDVRDEAGNTAVFETPQPVTLRQYGPALQTRDGRPLGPSSRTPGPYYPR